MISWRKYNVMGGSKIGIAEKEPPLYWGSHEGEVILTIVIAGETLNARQIVRNSPLDVNQVNRAITKLLQKGVLSYSMKDDRYRVKGELYRDYRTFIGKSNDEVSPGGARVINITACGAELAEMGILSDKLEATPDGIRKRIKEIKFVLSSNKGLSDENHQLLVGAIGELKTLSALVLLSSSYVVFNNINLDINGYLRYRKYGRGHSYIGGAQIDHVVVGPPGVFVVESKLWGLDTINQSVEYTVFEQIYRCKRALGTYLKQELGRSPVISQIIVQSGSTKFAGKKQVKVLQPNNLVRYIHSLRRCLQPERIEKIVDTLID